MIYPLSLHDALPISFVEFWPGSLPRAEEVQLDWRVLVFALAASLFSGLLFGLAPALRAPARELERTDRKSTPLNSSHSQISYAVFCLKNKKIIQTET